MRAWIGRGGGGAIRGSTGRELRFHRQNQKDLRKERRKACGPAPAPGKTSALWFREARRCPRALEALGPCISTFFKELKYYDPRINLAF